MCVCARRCACTLASAYACMFVFICTRVCQEADHVVGEEDSVSEGVPYGRGFRDWTGRHTKYEGRDSPHGGQSPVLIVQSISIAF